MKKISFGFFLAFSNVIGYAQPTLIDVRSTTEFDQSHADGAINLPVNNIEARIGSFESDKNADIYLYCRSGNRASVAQNILIKMGYTQVTNLGTLTDAQNFVEENVRIEE